ncbi:hypothetical protein [Leptolyngbya sp. NIES-2104]|uniref:hypothetical protein n=1 Tax=Leptolyngbya sp. NIES-2104 TaxID=1552121 RepID=UPI0006ECA0F7|nr:hypothetical protein [Leptolyngbya sp. NIES-2104]GAP93830.1 hypothetical protein NIES2104_03390 [Leptolyngbya sp. NIES-2104]
MISTELILEESQLEFLNQFQQYGFKDQHEVVRTALARLKQALQQERLIESAHLYAELYEEDLEVQALTEAALSDWTE